MSDDCTLVALILGVFCIPCVLLAVVLGFRIGHGAWPWGAARRDRG